MAAMLSHVEGDLSDVAVVAHLLQNRLAAVTGAAALLRSAPGLPEEARVELLEVVERSAASITPAIELLQRGLPAAALAEMSQGAPPLPRRSSGEDRPYPVPEDDAARVEALRRYDVLDQAEQPELARLARLTAHLTGAPVAFVNLIDGERQWQAASNGPARTEVPRSDAMCNVTVASGRSVVVPDASQDETFASSPWVTGVLGDVRLYVSVPLVAPGEHAIGTICVVDEAPGAVDPEVVAKLEDLAALGIAALEARLAARELRRLVGELSA
jgi:GAF domain-containing protein